MKLIIDRKSPTIRQLQYFIAVAEAANFRKAAEDIGVSQPALTTQIAALETALDVSLFERSRNGTLVSPQGRELLAAAREVVLNMESFLERASVIAGGGHVTYKLGVPPTLGPYLLPNVLPGLHARDRQRKLYVREDIPQRLQRGLMEGIYDIAILPLPISSMELSVEPLFVEPLKFVVPAEHRLAKRAAVAPADLQGERVLTLEDQHHFHHEVLEVCYRLGADIQRDYEGTSLDTLRQMVVMGMGVAFLPGLYVHSEMHDPEALWVTEIRGRPITRSHGLVWRSNSPARNFYRQLAEQMRSIVAERLHGVVALLD